MSNLRYSDEFKAAAISQVIDRGYSVREVEPPRVSRRLRHLSPATATRSS